MKLFKDFRNFAVRGNAVDLAVGVVIGSAFGKIVSSLVGDIIMPTVGLLIGGVDFSRYKLVLREAVGKKEEVAIRFGTFAQHVLDFLIIAAAIFLFVKLISLARQQQHKEQAATLPPAPPEEVLLLREIRDQLRQR